MDKKTSRIMCMSIVQYNGKRYDVCVTIIVMWVINYSVIRSSAGVICHAFNDNVMPICGIRKIISGANFHVGLNRMIV